MSATGSVKRGERPPLLSDGVYDRLATAILSGRYPPGTRLSVRQLAADFQVSQMPVRDALKRLAAERLVRFSPRRGVDVADMSPAELREVFEVRSCLEGYAARLACARLRPAEMDRLSRLHARMLRSADGPNHLAWLKSNEAFHMLVFRAAGNASLRQLLVEIWNRGKQRRPMASRAADVRGRRNREHAAILAAFAGRRPVEAEVRWRAHVERSGTDALRALHA